MDVCRVPEFSEITAHEAVPGHHYQIATQRELEDVPVFRKQSGFTSYSKGWTLYSQRVAWEKGFQDDPYDNLGRLQAELFRAVRLLVDTDIHAKRWTRDEATAYKVGMMEILRLREEAREIMGDAFDIRQFREVVLKNGAVPLHLLRDLVMPWANQNA